MLGSLSQLVVSKIIPRVNEYLLLSDFPNHSNWSFVSGYWEDCHSHWPTQIYFKRNEHFSSPFISKSRYGNLLKLLSLKVLMIILSPPLAFFFLPFSFKQHSAVPLSGIEYSPGCSMCEIAVCVCVHVCACALPYTLVRILETKMRLYWTICTLYISIPGSIFSQPK